MLESLSASVRSDTDRGEWYENNSRRVVGCCLFGDVVGCRRDHLRPAGREQRVPECCVGEGDRRGAESRPHQLQRQSDPPRCREGRDPDCSALQRFVGGRDRGRSDRLCWSVLRPEQSGRWYDHERDLYVRDGVPISFPAKDAPFEKFDYGLVVFSASAENGIGETVSERWGALTPVQVAPTTEYVSELIAGVSNPAQALSFTAVGYGTGEKFPIPGQETGPANPSGTNTSTFLIRYIADGLTYLAHNPINDVLRLSMNIAKGEAGTCNGDSGGPIFYEDQTLGRVQVSLVSGGDFPCRATNTGPGFSRPEAFAFIACARVAGGASEVAACVEDRFGS